jgi:ABC-type bacteriocin/lantibiotic exporter with double-glycine peptidase domain
LIISHRPLPLLRPDWILILKKGNIEAQGNHHFLMQNSRYYRQLLRLNPDQSAA